MANRKTSEDVLREELININEKLRTYQERYTLAIDNSGMYVWEYDIKQKRCIQEEKAIEEYHAPIVIENAPESIIARGLISEDSVWEYLRIHDEICSGAKEASAEIRFVKPDGSREWHKIKYVTVFDMEGNAVRAVGYSKNITDHKILELRYNHLLEYSAVAEPNTIVSFRLNLTQNIVELCKINTERLRNFKEYTNITELFASVLPSLSIEEDRKKVMTYLNREHLLAEFVIGNKELQLEYRRDLGDGINRWLRVVIKLSKNPKTDDVMGFLYTYDIHAQKMAQMLMDSVVQIDYDYLAEVDTQNDTYIFRSINDENSKIYVPSGVYSINNTSFIEKNVIEEDQQFALRMFDLVMLVKRLEAEGRYSFNYRMRDASGRVRTKKAQVFYIDKTSGYACIAGTDVTDVIAKEQRKNEMLHTALTAAEQANAAKSDFLSRMSHEIRTPMNAIIGMATIAANCIGNDEQVIDCLSKIGISSRFLLALINDILDMSRIESGKILLKNENIPFEEFIHSLNSICFSQAQAKNIDYESIIDPSVEDCYLGDAMKLQQVIINLLSNAVKFTPNGGKVTMSVRQMRKTKNDAVLRFVVNDTGCGISEEFLPHLFEPFSQEHNSNICMYNGTGLGLAICKNLVSLMDGKVDVRSIVGVGSEFTVEVKLGITEESKQHAQKMQIHNFSNLTALVVDDDVCVCEHAVMTLKEIGVTGEWVDSGKKAIEVVSEKWSHGAYYDLVLVDWKMPDMDGIETARNIRQIVGPDVTIIIMTAYDWASIELEAKKAGVNLLISKPMFKSTLISAFSKAFNEKNEEAATLPKDYDFTGKRALLAEDHPLNVEVAKRLLEHKGFTVEVAENGLKALEKFTTNPVGYYDIILMDIRMPEMDGLQSARSIRRWGKADAKTIPIVAMTANAFEDDVEKSKASGMNAHIAKPIEPVLLYRTLYECTKAPESNETLSDMEYFN